MVNDLTPLMDLPLISLHLPGSPIESIRPLSYCPLAELNIVGLPLKSITPLADMQLERLMISPLGLNEDDFQLLKELKLQQLCGPGDPVEQTPKIFFEKYLKLVDPID